MAMVAASDIPGSLITDIGQRVTRFAIGFLQMNDTPDRPDAGLRGSGTLIQLGNTRAILTAHHVLKALPRSGHLGLILSSNLGAPAMDVEGLQYIEIAHGTEEEQGPDLAVIILPPVVPSGLVAKKSFLNLAKYRVRMLNEPPGLDDGLWCVCGFQDELTDDVTPSHGFRRVKRFRGHCPIGWVEEASPIESYDYLTFPIPHGKGSPMPDRIGGTSGGGLWQILLEQEPDGQLGVRECLLSGVAFYQGRIERGWSPVRCHGRKSVYEVAYNAIQAAGGT